MSDYPSQSHSSVHFDSNLMSRMAAAKEAVWFRIGVLQSTMNDRDRALDAFERVLAVNPANVRAMTQAGAVLAKKECYPQAVAYLQRAIQADSTCGEAWAVLAHCYVMTDDLQKAYQAYQSALTHLPNPRDPNLWYGIGLLYDRYGSLDHALEAFLLVLSIAPDFERADEVCFCIGIIYKEQQNFDEALRYFNKVVVAANPPPPLTRADGWYQIGHVSELKRDIPTALEMYKQALAENPKHPKTLQNYGWLEHQHNNKSAEAIRLLKMSAELDSSDGQTWYLLGRVYMALREFRQAYDAYQQAVYRDSRNATFWCSIGVLYYQMNQFRDAMDAYSRAIILNPHVSEVWYDLGTLYESCGQNEDAIDAYRRAAKLAPDNTQITDRLTVLENSSNPSASAQQGQQQQQQQQHHPHSVSQPAISATPPISLSHPSQMHPDVPQRSLGHEMPHGVSSTFSQPLHLMSESRRPSQPQQSSPLQFNPPALVSSQTQSLPQSRQPGLANLSGQSASAPMEMAPIPSMQAPSALTESHPGTSNSSFPPNDRQSLRTGPFPPVSTSNSVKGPSVNHLVSQPRPSQGSSTFLPQITQSAPVSVDVMPLRSSPGDSQMKTSTHPSFHQNSDGIRPQNNMPPKDRSSGGHPGNSAGPHSPSKPSQSMHSPQKNQIRNDQQDTHGQSQPSSYEQGVNGRSQNQQQQGGQQSIPSPSRHSMHAIASQPDTSLHQIPLQPITGLPPVQQQSNDDGEKSERHRGGLNTSGDDRERSTTAIDTGNTASQFGQGDNTRRNDYDTQEHRDDGRLPKMTRSDGGNDGSGNATDVDSNNRASFSAPMPSASMSQSRDRIHRIRESIGDDGNPSSNNTRQMVLHDVSHSDNTHESRRHAPQRHDNSQHEERENNGQNGRDQTQQNGASDGKSDRLPSMNSLPSMDMNANRPMQDDGDMRGSIPQVSPPSLSLPSSGALPSMNVTENVKPNSSPSHGGSSPGAGPAMGTAGASLPPLSSGRGTGSLGRMNQDPKDLTNSGGGITSSLGGLGTSSLTKFGRGPQTPSTNSVVPASLPSPLSRKPTTGPTMVHSGRSPRLSKPTSGGAYKPIPMPVSSSNYGPMEQVPSPGSLPVLPPMNSRPGNYNDDEKANDKRVSDSDRDAEHHAVDNRKFSGEDKSGKEGGENNGHGRVSEDVLDNKPVFGVLRPGNSGEKELDRSESDEKVKSSEASPSRGHGENVLPGKRENISKDDMGRTPKRPRLHDVNDKDMGAEMYGYEGNEDGEKGKDLSQRKDDENGKSSVSGMNKNDHKGERRTGSGGPDDGKKHLRRDSTGRGEGEMGKSGLSSQVIDLPRLSNQAMPKLAGPPLSGNQPLPSFRSERKNLSASRGSGGASVGKSLNADSSTRGSLPFALRSAPVSSIAPLKNLGGGSTGGRGGGEHGDYESSPRMGDGSGPKRVNDDKTDGSMTRGSGRDRE